MLVSEYCTAFLYELHDSEILILTQWAGLFNDYPITGLVLIILVMRLETLTNRVVLKVLRVLPGVTYFHHRGLLHFIGDDYSF